MMCLIPIANIDMWLTIPLLAFLIIEVVQMQGTRTYVNSSYDEAPVRLI